MAEKPYVLQITGRDSREVALIKWGGLALNDTGQPYLQPRLNDRSIHVKGTFGTGGTCVIEGSLEGSVTVPPTTYAPLNDPQGNLLSIDSEKIESVLENVTAIRPRVSAGDGTTLLDVYLLMSM